MTMIGLLGVSLCTFGLAQDATVKRNEGFEWSDIISPPNGVLVMDEDVSRPTCLTFFGKARGDSPYEALAWMIVRRDTKPDSDRFFDPAKTTITTRFKPVVKQQPDGTWEITFGASAVRSL